MLSRIDDCKECLEVLRKGLCGALMEKFVEIVGSLDVKEREVAEGYEVVSLGVMPLKRESKRKRRR